MRLFIGEIFPDRAELRADEIHHIIKVLRMNDNEEIYVTDGKGKWVGGKLRLKGKKAEVEILEIFPQEPLSERILHIAIAPTKSLERFEFFLEKSVELGVSEITPLISVNSERKNLNLEKMQKQLENACKQSLRVLFPRLNPLTPLKDFMEKNAENQLFVAHCYQEYEKISLKKVFGNQKNITILIGPEGDFSKHELELLLSQGATGVDLGKNRLRTETAGIFTVAGFYYSHL
ncbi:MAG: 16S rRNA (uracil(1498)-N(3))-methyltransferase [Flavobacteriaceae bacterium]|nr:16S rRNA (uracil(1498)-N(3))-methyltransferase [Flavobacteriaceae bacterium]